MQPLLQEFLRDETGAAAIEYGLVVALISVSIIVALTILGINLRDKFAEVGDRIYQAGR